MPLPRAAPAPSGTGYVANFSGNTVSVLDTATNTVTGTIPGFDGPYFMSIPTASYYPFAGFDPPVSNAPILNAVHAGQAVALAFSLGSDKRLNIFAAGYPAVQQVNCSSSVPVNNSIPAQAAGGSGLTYDATTNTYTYVWKTTKTMAGTCQKLLLSLTDGSIHTAMFQMK